MAVTGWVVGGGAYGVTNYSSGWRKDVISLASSVIAVAEGRMS